jgi:hypothetical protein
MITICILLHIFLGLCAIREGASSHWVIMITICILLHVEARISIYFLFLNRNLYWLSVRKTRIWNYRRRFCVLLVPWINKPSWKFTPVSNTNLTKQRIHSVICTVALSHESKSYVPNWGGASSGAGTFGSFMTFIWQSQEEKTKKNNERSWSHGLHPPPLLTTHDSIAD